MKSAILSLILFVTIMLNGCSGVALDSATPTPIKLKTGFGGVTGKIEKSETRWVGKTIYVYAAKYYESSSKGQGVYVLEPALDAHTTLEQSGFFQLGDLPPGQYVIIVGPEPEQSAPISDEEKPQVVQVVADQITNLGVIVLDAPPQASPSP